MKSIALITLMGLLGIAQAESTAVKIPVYQTCEAADAPHFKNTTTVGGAAGMTSGVGISYRRWFDANGVQLVLLPLVKLEGDNQDIFLSAGINGMHALWESPMANWLWQPTRSLVYSYGGIHYIREKMAQKDEWGEVNNEAHTFTMGLGFGVQLNVNSIQLSLGLGLAARHNIDKDHMDTNPKWGSSNNISPTIDASAGYTFGWR